MPEQVVPATRVLAVCGVIVRSLDPQEIVLWAHSCDGAGREMLVDVAVTPDGEPVMIGSSRRRLRSTGS